MATGTLGVARCLGRAPDTDTVTTQDGRPDPDDDADVGGVARETTPTTQFQYDARNSGVADGDAPESADVRWRTTIDPVDGGLAVADGRVVVAASGNLVALDAATGDVRWDVPVGHGIEAPPALTGDTAFVTSWNGGPKRDRGVAAIALDDGSERWRAAPDVDVTSAPSVADESVYVGGSLNSDDVIAIDADGAERWSIDLRGYAFAPTGAGDGVVVTDDSVARCLDVDGGNERWRHEVRERQISDVVFVGIRSPPVVADGVAYVASHSGDVYGLAAE